MERRRRWISSAAGACVFSWPVLTRLSKLTRISDHPELGRLPDRHGETIARLTVAQEIGPFHHRGIHFAAEHRLCRRECSHRFGKSDIADDHEIHIAS